MNNKLLFPAIRDISHKMAHCANYAIGTERKLKHSTNLAVLLTTNFSIKTVPKLM